ncbi:sialin-like [Liolophura sinensis]|uniref:sialin-like n=1 Tax=Liolophura sinensis TaxID=3198878 RepID=UPI0031590085
MMKDKFDLAKNEKEKVPVYTSFRWAISLVGFVGFVFVYALRIDFSVAIVCMVKTPNVSSLFLNNGSIVANVSTETDDGCTDETGKAGGTDDRGEFDWDKTLQSQLLASFFYGYVITQIPGGWLARKFGCRRVLGGGMALCIISTLLLPVCARTHVYLVFAARAIAGLATGVAFPAAHCLWGRWAPPLERSKLMALCYAGPPIGNIITLSISGLLCAYGFDNGWGSIFYVYGLGAAVWLLAWFYVVHDRPRDHPRITEIERDFIEQSIGDHADISDKDKRTPWLDMAKSPALWACITAHICNNWTNYSLLTALPTYMKEVLKFDIKQNGLLSAIPYICQFLSSVVAGYLADTIRQRKWLSTTATRRTFQIIAFVGASASLVATGFVTCENRMLAIVFLALAVSFLGLSRGGYLVNHVDFGPRFAGELFGITNTCATLPGMIAPLVNGALTTNKTQGEWQKVFFLCAGFAFFGAIIFGIFARGEVQHWARISADEPELEVTAREENGTKKNGKVNEAFSGDSAKTDSEKP